MGIMELKDLKTFVEVVRQGGFSQAAKVVFATQSTVSKAVNSSKTSSGSRYWTGLGIRAGMTAAGEIVYRRAIRLLAERDDLTGRAGGAARPAARRAAARPAADRLQHAVRAAVRALSPAIHPEVEIRLVEHGSDQLSELLQAGEIDFAGLLPPIADEFAWQVVRREPLMALLSTHHPLAQRDPRSLWPSCAACRSSCSRRVSR